MPQAGHAKQAAEPGNAWSIAWTFDNWGKLKDKGKEYEIGDIVLNKAAEDDVMENGELAPYDQSHLFVDAKKLGYEIGFSKPNDPFRWNQIHRG